MIVWLTFNWKFSPTVGEVSYHFQLFQETSSITDQPLSEELEVQQSPLLFYESHEVVGLVEGERRLILQNAEIDYYLQEKGSMET